MKKIFTVLIALFPVLSVYSAYIPSVSIADLGLIITTLFIIIEKFCIKKKLKFNLNKFLMPIFLFFIYIIISFLIQLILDSGVEILSTIRFLLYILILIMGFDYFDFKFGIKILKYATLIISIYTIIQFSFFIILHVTLPWRVPGLKVMDESFILKEASTYYLTFYRPTGVFLEPTHLVQYIFVYLVYILFRVDSKLDLKNAIIISTAIVCSGSSLGMFLLIVTWGMWAIRKAFNRNLKISFILGSIVACIILVIISPIVLKLPYIEKIFTRVITDGGLNGAAVGYRFKSLELILENHIPTIYRIIGYGRGTNDVYMTAIPYLIYCNGIIGFGIYLWMMVNLIVKTKYFPRALAIIILITSTGSEMIINFGVLFYTMYIISGEFYRRKV